MGFCCTMTPQQRHASLSKIIIFLCTALLVHMITMAHVHKHEQKEEFHKHNEGKKDGGKKSHSFSLSLGCSNSHSHSHAAPGDKAPSEDGVESIEMLTVDEAKDSNGNVVVEIDDEMVGMRKTPLRAADLPLTHPNNRHRCFVFLAAKISLIAGLIAGFCGRPRAIRFWMFTILGSAVAGTIVAIHHAAHAPAGGVPQHHLAAHIGAIFFAHLIALAVARRFLFLSRATFEAPAAVEVVGVALEEVPVEKCAA